MEKQRFPNRPLASRYKGKNMERAARMYNSGINYITWYTAGQAPSPHRAICESWPSHLRGYPGFFRPGARQAVLAVQRRYKSKGKAEPDEASELDKGC